MYFEFEKRTVPFLVEPNFTEATPIPHIHPHIELIYLVEGEMHATADANTQILHPGELYLSFPNQVHYYDATPIFGVLMIVDPELFPDLLDIFTTKVPEKPIVSADRLPEDIHRRLLDICSAVRSGGKLQRIAAQSYLQGILAEALGQMTLVKRKHNRDSVREILLYCLENYKKPLTLEMLGKQLHLSKYHISHVFTQRLHLSFPEFINGLRVESACRRLDKGHNVTEVAYAAGFSSIRSFNRNFERVMGVSPSQYKKQVTAAQNAAKAAEKPAIEGSEKKDEKT